MTPTPSYQSFRFRRTQRHGDYDPSRTPTRDQITPAPVRIDRAEDVDAGEGEGIGEENEEHEGSEEEVALDADGANADEEGEDEEEEEEEEEAGIDEVPMEIDAPWDPTALGLKEIGNLASWTVSSCKPGCGVEALRDEDTGLFWQSDGPQPHHLNIHFSRLVSILSIRIFLDFDADESYTPTRITLLAGTGYHDLIPFHALNFEQPRGWIDVPLDHVGGGPDGKTLRAFLVQVKVVENHQNGKDTHVRGLKIYGSDEKGARAVLDGLDALEKFRGNIASKPQVKMGGERTWLVEPDWMGDPELR